jgi:hypothetical protein
MITLLCTALISLEINHTQMKDIKFYTGGMDVLGSISKSSKSLSCVQSARSTDHRKALAAGGARLCFVTS